MRIQTQNQKEIPRTLTAKSQNLVTACPKSRAPRERAPAPKAFHRPAPPRSPPRPGHAKPAGVAAVVAELSPQRRKREVGLQLRTMRGTTTRRRRDPQAPGPVPGLARPRDSQLLFPSLPAERKHAGAQGGRPNAVSAADVTTSSVSCVWTSLPLLPSYSLSSLQPLPRLTVCICFVLCRVPAWQGSVPSFPSQFHEQMA